MPLYDYSRKTCDWRGERNASIANRDRQKCGECGTPLMRHVAAPLGRVWGVCPKGGGPDRFTADVLGVPLKDLPSGLRSNVPLK